MKSLDASSPDLSALRRGLLSATQFGALLAAAFGGFYSNIAPPDQVLKFWPPYASFLAGLIFIVSKRFSITAARIIMWVAIAFAVVLPVFYYAKYQELIVTYSGTKLICGTEYTARGQEYVKEHPAKTGEDLMLDFQGQLKDIWTQDSINHAHLKLGLLYSGGFACLALAVLTGLQEFKEPARKARQAAAGR